MQRQHRKHYRVAMRELEETPKQGMYVTQRDAKMYAFFTTMVSGILFLLLLCRIKSCD